MGYSVEAYLVDLDQLHGVYGSQDLGLLEAIARELPHELARLDRLVAESNARLAADHDPARHGPLILLPSVEAAMRAYVAGTILEPVEYSEGSYRFALLLFCMCLGRSLPSDRFHGLQPPQVGFLAHEAPAIGDVIFRSPPFGPEPFPNDWRGDWNVGQLSWQGAAWLLRDWRVDLAVGASQTHAWQRRASAQFHGWLEEAVRQRRGVVTFFS